MINRKNDNNAYFIPLELPKGVQRPLDALEDALLLVPLTSLLPLPRMPTKRSIMPDRENAGNVQQRTPTLSLDIKFDGRHECSCA